MFAEVTGEKQNKFQLNRHFYLIFGKVKRKSLTFDEFEKAKMTCWFKSLHFFIAFIFRAAKLTINT